MITNKYKLNFTSPQMDTYFLIYNNKVPLVILEGPITFFFKTNNRKLKLNLPFGGVFTLCYESAIDQKKMKKIISLKC